MIDNFWIQLGIALALIVWVWTWKVDAPGCGADCEQGDKPCKCRGNDGR